MKRCPTCAEVKSRDDFHKNRSAHDGLQTECRSCRAERQRARRQADPELHQLQRRRAYAADPEREYARVTAHRAAHPGRIAAYDAVRRALGRGDLTRPDACGACGCSDRRIEAHHDDYAKPLDVCWLCASCHKHKHMAEVS